MATKKKATTKKAPAKKKVTKKITAKAKVQKVGFVTKLSDGLKSLNPFKKKK